MSSWPRLRPELLDDGLLRETAVVQRVVGLGRSARNGARLKVRQPLSRLLVRVPDDDAAAAVRRHEALIRDELNVKAVELVARDAQLVSYRIKPNLPVVGKRYGKQIPAIRAWLGQADGAAIARAVAQGQSQTFSIDGQSLTFEPGDFLVETESAQGFACAEEGGYMAGLDTTLNDALVREGVARELIRVVQDSRKQAGLEVSDRIELTISGGPAVEAAVKEHREVIMAETLSLEWRVPPESRVFRVTGTLGDEPYVVHLARVTGAADD
jgi:isoleucyl-tRNA synthetase